MNESEGKEKHPTKSTTSEPQGEFIEQKGQPSRPEQPPEQSPNEE